MDKTKEPPAPLEFDSEGGTITDKGLETRVTVLRVQGWASLKNELESTFMSGAAVILQRMGHSYGRYLVRLAKLNALKSKKEVTAKSIMGILQDAARTHGWGRLTIGSGDFELGAATLIMKNCFFCLLDKKGTTQRCYFLVGLVQGVADEATGFPHRVVEGRCAAKDDGLCEIKAERVTAQS